MGVKVLHSIIHNELMPWVMQTSNTKPIVEMIKKVGHKQAANEKELTQQLKLLLADHSVLITWLDKQNSVSLTPLSDLLYTTNLPAFTDTVTKFYSLLISKESLRVFNSFFIKSKKWSNRIDINYNTNILLKSITVLTKQTVKEIKERGFEEFPDEDSNHIHFVLHYLKHSLIALFFSVQEIHKDSLEQLTTLEDFYLLELGESISAMQELHPAKAEAGTTLTKSQPKLSFGFNREAEKLKVVINQLCFKLQFLNEDISSVDALLKQLTSKNIIPGSAKIQLGCETRVFRYIIDKLQPYFYDLSFANIEKSALFFSKKDTPITANNLSASNKRGEPKEKETIDKIIKHLQ